MRAKEIEFLSLQAYEIDNGVLRLVFLPGVGGRLISMKFLDREILYYPEDIANLTVDLTAIKEEISMFRMNDRWRHYGGYKTWMGPQERWGGPPYLDLDSGVYLFTQKEMSNNEWMAEMVSPVCRETGMQLIRRFFLKPGLAEIRVVQGMTNKGRVPAAWSIWDVTMVKGPGEAVFPVCPGRLSRTGVKEFFNNIVKTDGMEEAPPVSPLMISDKIARLECRQKASFKFGSLPDEGWLEGILPFGNKKIIYRKEFETNPGLPYAHGCAVEVYDSAELPYFEMEIHSPLFTVPPGETVWFPAVWKMECR